MCYFRFLNVHLNVTRQQGLVIQGTHRVFFLVVVEME